MYDNSRNDTFSLNIILSLSEKLQYVGGRGEPKTEAMICETKHKRKNKEGLAVKCRDTTIKTTNEVKYLGVKLDETLSGEGTVDTIVKKCSGKIKFLYGVFSVYDGIDP